MSHSESGVALLLLLLCFLGNEPSAATSTTIDIASFKPLPQRTPRLRTTRTNGPNGTTEAERVPSPYEELLSGKDVRVVGKDCGGEYVVEDGEAILLTAHLVLFSTRCEHSFQVRNSNSTLILKDLSLVLRINCNYEYLEIISDAMSAKYCNSWKYNPQVLIKGKKITVRYVRKLFQIHGGFALVIAATPRGSKDAGGDPLDDLVTMPPTTTSLPTLPPLPEQMGCPACGQRQGAPLQRKAAAELSTRIVGGTTAEEGEFPFIVFLKIKFENEGPYMCGGSLLTSTTILTAAHCVVLERGMVPTIVAKAGLHNVQLNDTSNTQTRTGEVIKSHENYDDWEIINDIAVIVVSEPFTFSAFVQPVCLPPRDFRQLSSGTVTAVGWGALDFRTGKMPSKLQKVVLDVTPFPNCSAVWKKGAGVGLVESQVCAYKSGKDTCSGDSGGPLLLWEESRWVIYGITSYGYECAKENYPGVYTRVSSFLSWIHPYLSVNDCQSPQ